MKVKRFVGETMQQALKMIRDELGDDAVILSNRKTDRGVEIVTAVDYDEDSARDQLAIKDPQTSPAHLANMMAERFVKLEEAKEMAKRRIQEARRVRHGESDDADNAAPIKPPVNVEPLHQPQRPMEPQDALAEMKSEILHLREMINAQLGGEQIAKARRGREAAEDNADAPSAADNKVVERLKKRLEQIGFTQDVYQLMREAVPEGHALDDAWQHLQRAVVKRLKVFDEEIVDKGGRYAFLGPTGVGKTTTIAKLAARFVMRHGSDDVALVTTDRYRIAAHEQLLAIGRILDVPVYVADEKNKLDDVLHKLRDYRLVLVDTAGLNHHDQNWSTQMAELERCRIPLEKILVLATTSQKQVLQASYHLYKQFELAGCVLTKVDETCSLGESLSVALLNRLPIAYITDGQNIPDDIEYASSVTLLNRAIKVMKQNAREASIIVESS